MGQTAVNTRDPLSVKSFLPNGQWDNIWPIVESYCDVEFVVIRVVEAVGAVDVLVFDDTHLCTLDRYGEVRTENEHYATGWRSKIMKDPVTCKWWILSPSNVAKQMYPQLELQTPVSTEAFDALEGRIQHVVNDEFIRTWSFDIERMCRNRGCFVGTEPRWAYMTPDGKLYITYGSDEHVTSFHAGDFGRASCQYPYVAVADDKKVTVYKIRD
jgi:hypothetical protein